MLFGISVTTLAMLAGWLSIGLESTAELHLDVAHTAEPSWFSWFCVVTLTYSF